MSKPCTCVTLNGARYDKDGLPLWVKMEGCPSCDWQIYTPDSHPKLTPEKKVKDGGRMEGRGLSPEQREHLSKRPW